MLQINFYPESDEKEFTKAAKEYAQIWSKDADKIVRLIEKYSGMKFKTKVINAVTFEGRSFSKPMSLRSSYPRRVKEAVLVHELLHRLLIDNNFWFGNKDTYHEDVHKMIDLILFDIWVDLLGKKVAKESQELEISFGDPAYKRAWSWALSFSKDERPKKFQEMKKKYQKSS
ncbi:hypothetical protein CMO96_02250 [Candidatus Woesebacteria bacterium]|nr:hypothetical protein [Candidatus Woesebacteria bacterium]